MVELVVVHCYAMIMWDRHSCRVLARVVKGPVPATAVV